MPLQRDEMAVIYAAEHENRINAAYQALSKC